MLNLWHIRLYVIVFFSDCRYSVAIEWYLSISSYSVMILINIPHSPHCIHSLKKSPLHIIGEQHDIDKYPTLTTLYPQSETWLYQHMTIVQHQHRKQHGLQFSEYSRPAVIHKYVYNYVHIHKYMYIYVYI
jgi:hypothetical protein